MPRWRRSSEIVLGFGHGLAHCAWPSIAKVALVRAVRARPHREVSGEVARRLAEKDADERGEAVDPSILEPVEAGRETVDVRRRRCLEGGIAGAADGDLATVPTNA